MWGNAFSNEPYCLTSFRAVFGPSPFMPSGLKSVPIKNAHVYELLVG